MNVNEITNFNGIFSLQTANKKSDTQSTFSKVLDNLKKGKPADYDEESAQNQNTTTMIQVMSDGSTLVTVYDESGKVISQNKTRAAKFDPDAHIIGTEVDSKNLATGELMNLVNFGA